MKEKLTDKQIKFCEEYLVDLNATQAAIRAGYSNKTATSIAAENLTKPYIQEYLSKRQKDLQEATGITQKRVLEEYAKVAFVDIREAFAVDGGLHNLKQIDDNTASAIASVESLEQTLDGMVIGTVRKVKFHDKLRALDALGRHLGIFEKDNKQRGEIKINIDNDDAGLGE